MENNLYNTLQSLVFDISFRKWVLGAEDADKQYWEQWLDANPGKTDIVNDARNIIYALNIKFETLSSRELQQQVAAIIKLLDRDNDEPAIEQAPIYKLPFIKRNILWWAAASVIIIIVAALIFTGNKKNDAVTAFLRKKKTNEYTTVSNHGKADTLVILPDGSQVRLSPGSSIEYSANFAALYRETYLTGRALFHVVKNPEHPFFVYTASIVTRVLGTKFYVTSYPGDSAATVDVESGRVSVFKRENFKAGLAGDDTANAKVITANQKIVYTKNAGSLVKTIVTRPLIIVPETTRETLVFNATPVKDVFAKLNKLYGIDINYNSDAVAGCSLSASLEDESFYDKLDIICKAINATYRVTDGSITVDARGCK
ncbi:MAG TPA: FecR family protein [Chitinophagaceae bacterium]|nr:FecR family protein [Chitinophagaceae bacterium]